MCARVLGTALAAHAVAAAQSAQDPTPSAQVVDPRPESAPSADAGQNVPKRVRLLQLGQCPDAESTRRHVEPLLRRHALAGESDDANDLVATLRDEGARFRVTVAGSERLVDEPARDCLERARIAAVLIAMALEPPAIVSEEPPPVATEAPVAETPVPASSSPSSRAEPPLSLGLEAFALLAWGAQPDAVSPGLGPLVAVRGGHGAWFSRFALGFVPARELTVTTGRATMARVPLDLSVGHAWSFDAWALEASLGVAADPLFVRAEGLKNAGDEVRFDVGPRATLGLAVGPPSMQGLALLRAAWFPANYHLIVEPTGTVGETPSLWLEIALGMRFDLR